MGKEHEVLAEKRISCLHPSGYQPNLYAAWSWNIINDKW